jgi:hypothetical protein
MAGLWSVVKRARSRRVANQHAKRAADDLGQVADTTALAQLARDETIIVEGRLISGTPREGLRDGSPAAVVGVAVAERLLALDGLATLLSHSATGLVIEVGDRRLAIVEPIELLGGGEQWWPCVTPTGDDLTGRLPDALAVSELWASVGATRGVHMTLRPGELVRLRGRAKRLEDDDTSAGYRDLGAKWCLQDVAVVGLDTPRVVAPWWAWLRSPVLVVLALGGALGWLALWNNYQSTEWGCRQACERVGQCTVVPRRRLSHDFVCAAMSRDDCRDSTMCRERGECTPVDRSCQVGNDDDCLASSRCRQDGQCSLVGHQCELLSDADCGRTNGCRDEARCSRMREQRRGYVCVADPRAICAASRQCKRYGACQVDDERNCVVASSDDCAQSEACDEQGRCSAVERDAKWHCVAGSDADCAQSTQCKWDGHCTRRGGRCGVASGEDCDGPCRRVGRCAATDIAKGPNLARCRAESAEDCQASEACQRFELKCHFRHGQCADSALPTPRAPDCRRTSRCEEDGICTLRDGHCVAGSDADCHASTGCQQQGRCSASADVCKVVSDDDCRRSEACTLMDQCFATAGQCLSTPP